MDLPLLIAGLTGGLSTAAVALARRRFTGTATSTAAPDHPTAAPTARLPADDPVAQSAQRVTEVLRRPEITQLLDRFDARIDTLLTTPA